jgi:hypothetical protein
MIRFACVVAALLVLSATPAEAQLRAVADGPTPVLFGDRVLWGTRSNGIMHFVSAPVTGNPPAPAVPFGDVPMRARDVMWLAASGAQVAVQLRDFGAPRAPGRLYAAGPDGAFRELAGDVGEEPFDPLWPPVSVTTQGVFTQEATPTLRSAERSGDERSARGSGAKTAVVLPPEGDPGFVAAAGGLGVASTDGALIVFDLRSGTELHQVSLEEFDAQVTSLALSPTGDVAATVAVGDGSDVLLWAPAGASRVRVLATQARMETVATAGGRVAYVGSNRLDSGVRVTVLDGATGTTLFRGPISETADRLSFDGSYLTFATGGCTLVATVDPASSADVLPPGPCVRSEATVAPVADEQQHGNYRLEVACLSAPAADCRVDVRLKTLAGHPAGRLAARVARGRSRVLHIPLRAHGQQFRITVRVTDPDGRTRTIYDA